MIRDIRKAIIAIAIAALMIVQVVGNSAATTPSGPSPAFTDPDISAEARILHDILLSFRRLDTSSYDLLKKNSLTRTEFAAFERQANDLKRRLPATQNAVGRAIDKLKAAGQFDDLGKRLSMKTDDPSYIVIARQGGAKKVLEEAAREIVNSTNEIDGLIDKLTGKVRDRAEVPILEDAQSDLASRAIRVGLSPSVAKPNLGCRLSTAALITSLLSPGRQFEAFSNNAVRCYCDGNQPACNGL